LPIGTAPPCSAWPLALAATAWVAWLVFLGLMVAA
jgi:hypothetical protein